MPEVMAPDAPPGLQHKSATAEPIVTTDDTTGEVTAVVSVTNVVDEVGDIILPGAYAGTLAKRKPKGVWSHSWKDWVARTEEIREYPPGDSQLKALLDEAGASLPADAGALVVRCKFNMDDPDSYKAYQKVKFFSETGECQWSIGYSVPPKMGVRDAKGIRRIKGLELFEYSPVLFGAASQSTSLSVKSLDPAEWPDQEEKTTDTAEAEEVETTGDEATEEIDWSAVEIDPNAAEPTDEELDEVESVAREAAGVGDADDPGDAAEEGSDAAEPQPNAEPAGDTEGNPPEVEGSDGTDEEAEPAEFKRKFSQGERDKAADSGAAMPDGSFPIKNEQDLRNAIKAYGRAKNQAAAKRHIIKRARALGLTNLLPDGWTTSTKSDDPAEILAELRDRLAVIEEKYDTSPVGKPGGRQNWVDKAGGLPPFIRAVAHALIRAGHSKQQAIQLAVGVIRRWAAGGGDVTAKTRAKAAATIARWDAMKGSKDVEAEAGVEAPEASAEETPAEPAAEEAASGEPAGLLTKWDPAAEIGRHAAHKPTPDESGHRVPVENKDIPQLAGSYEERREMVRQALCNLLEPEDDTTDPDSPAPRRYYVSVDGTWGDQVVATVYGNKDGDNQTYRVPYSIEASDAGTSLVVLGDPQPVRLSLQVDSAPADDDSGYDLPAALMDGMDAAMVGAKLLAASPETKAGRVLSGANATKIATAVESLIAVLQAAGVEIDMPAPPAAAPETEGTAEAKSAEVEEFDPAELLVEAARLRSLVLRS